MNKLRVVHLITKLELGGAQQNTLYTASHLNPDRYEVHLVSGVGGLLDEETKKLGLPIHWIPSLIRSIHPIKDLEAFESLYKLFRQLKPHIVHTHSSKAGILGRLAAYVSGVPVVIHTYHGFGFHPMQRPFVQKIFHWVERFCALTAQHHIFVSQANLNQARELKIVTTNQSLIRSGISFQMPETSSLRTECSIPEDAWVVLSVGNFKPQKNPTELVEVAKRLITADSAIHVVLTGDGPLKDKLQATLNENELKRIHFLGWRRDIGNLLVGCDSFLLTSRWEGLPRALVEAFAAKRPAVAYAVDGVSDILIEGETGYPITPGDMDAAVEKTLDLKNHPKDAVQMGANGYARVRHEFDIDTMVTQQETLYETLYQKVPLKSLYQLPD